MQIHNTLLSRLFPRPTKVQPDQSGNLARLQHRREQCCCRACGDWLSTLHQNGQLKYEHDRELWALRFWAESSACIAKPVRTGTQVSRTDMFAAERKLLQNVENCVDELIDAEQAWRASHSRPQAAVLDSDRLWAQHFQKLSELCQTFRVHEKEEFGEQDGGENDSSCN